MVVPDSGEWNVVLDFWFPEGRGLDIDPALHRDNWVWRMQGKADAMVVSRFSDLTERAARGDLDDWAGNPHGRLALIIALDQFPRSVWKNSPLAFAQDPKALALTLEGYANGHYEALETPWFKTVFNLPLLHCEGPDHLERLDRAIALAQDILAKAPDPLKPGYTFAAGQPVEIRKVIAAFGRHPHRNQVLGRPSTADEQVYLAEGRFPHLNAIPKV